MSESRRKSLLASALLIGLPLLAAHGLAAANGAHVSSRVPGAANAAPATPGVGSPPAGTRTEPALRRSSVGERAAQAALAQPLGPSLEPIVQRAHLDRTSVSTMQQGQPLCPVPDGGDPFAVIDVFATAEMTRSGFPGASLAIAKDGQLIYERGYGVKRADGQDPVDAQTVFRAGSVTKMMTAAALLRQAQAGKVDLDAPVRRYVPDFSLADPVAAERMTVRDLLVQSTGMPDMLTGFTVDGPRTDEALTEFARGMAEILPMADPGSFFNYSNANFSMAGLVAERAAGTPYHTLMADLWQRAGMTSTMLLPADVIARGDYSYGHSHDLATGEPVIYGPDAYDNWWGAPAGYMFTTAGDLVRWASLLMDGGGDVLPPDLAAAMQSPQIDMLSVPGSYYGYGTMIERYGDVDLHHHPGNMPGWGGFVVWLPDRDFAVATLNNADGNLIGSALCAMSALEGIEPPASQPDYSTDPAAWSRYAGDYRIVDYLFTLLGLTDDRTYEGTVSQSDDVLRLSIPSVPDPISPTLSFSRTLAQAYLDTFTMDVDMDGTQDAGWALTFIDAPGGSGVVKWMRHRQAVGTRKELLPTPTPAPTELPPGRTLFLPALHNDGAGA